MGFFETSISSSDNTVVPPPVNNWKDLEILVIDDITSLCVNDNSGYGTLVRWLTRRQELGQPLLHVAHDPDPMKYDLEGCSHMYNALQRCCSLELVNILFFHYHWVLSVRFLFH